MAGHRLNPAVAGRAVLRSASSYRAQRLPISGDAVNYLFKTRRVKKWMQKRLLYAALISTVAASFFARSLFYFYLTAFPSLGVVRRDWDDSQLPDKGWKHKWPIHLQRWLRRLPYRQRYFQHLSSPVRDRSQAVSGRNTPILRKRGPLRWCFELFAIAPFDCEGDTSQSWKPHVTTPEQEWPDLIY